MHDDTTTHAALAIPTPGHRTFRNEAIRIIVSWGGGQARVHVRQFQPHISSRYEIAWDGDRSSVRPQELLRKVLEQSAQQDGMARFFLFALDEGELDWWSPVDMRGRDRDQFERDARQP